jgi:hypothetical protein
LALDTLKDRFVNQLLLIRKFRYFHEIASSSQNNAETPREREFFVDNLLVRFRDD